MRRNSINEHEIIGKWRSNNDRKLVLSGLEGVLGSQRLLAFNSQVIGCVVGWGRVVQCNAEVPCLLPKASDLLQD